MNKATGSIAVWRGYEDSQAHLYDIFEIAGLLCHFCNRYVRTLCSKAVNGHLQRSILGESFLHKCDNHVMYMLLPNM